jgi:hypothetical protein
MTSLTGFSVLLQSNHLRQAMQPYVLGGACGRLLDADHDRLGEAAVQGFEMEELMHGRTAVLPVLSYLFRRLEERFDGPPVLLVLDEAWVFLDDPAFAGRIRGGRPCARRTPRWCSPPSPWLTCNGRASRRRSSRVAPVASSCPIRRRSNRSCVASMKGSASTIGRSPSSPTPSPSATTTTSPGWAIGCSTWDLGPSRSRANLDAGRSARDRPRHSRPRAVPVASAWLRQRGLAGC